MNLDNALGRYVYLQHCNVSWHPANTWKESNFRREEVTSPIIIFKAPVSLILWSYQRFMLPQGKEKLRCWLFAGYASSYLFKCNT